MLEEMLNTRRGIERHGVDDFAHVQKTIVFWTTDCGVACQDTTDSFRQKLLAIGKTPLQPTTYSKSDGRTLTACSFFHGSGDCAWTHKVRLYVRYRTSEADFEVTSCLPKSRRLLMSALMQGKTGRAMRAILSALIIGAWLVPSFSFASCPSTVTGRQPLIKGFRTETLKIDEEFINDVDFLETFVRYKGRDKNNNVRERASLALGDDFLYKPIDYVGPLANQLQDVIRSVGGEWEIEPFIQNAACWLAEAKRKKSLGGSERKNSIEQGKNNKNQIGRPSAPPGGTSRESASPNATQQKYFENAERALEALRAGYENNKSPIKESSQRQIDNSKAALHCMQMQKDGLSIYFINKCPYAINLAFCWINPKVDSAVYIDRCDNPSWRGRVRDSQTIAPGGKSSYNFTSAEGRFMACRHPYWAYLYTINGKGSCVKGY